MSCAEFLVCIDYQTTKWQFFMASVSSTWLHVCFFDLSLSYLKLEADFFFIKSVFAEKEVNNK